MNGNKESIKILTATALAVGSTEVLGQAVRPEPMMHRAPCWMDATSATLSISPWLPT